ncbi:MAG: signal peptidase I [Vicinamibacteria bacterium]|nr:signal peptidase I [Vicinamibacteria bacterium]
MRPLFVTAMVLGSFRSAIADWNDVPSGSMRPTVLEGERVFVNRAAYDLKVPFTTWRLAQWSDPSRGDIVVLYSPHDGNRLLKRVVGVPGDRIEMKDNQLIVNGTNALYRNTATPDGDFAVLRETVFNRAHLVEVAPKGTAASTFGPVVVPPLSYLVMGDNRDNSFDSRFFGFVPRSEILGRATRIVASVDPARSFRPRFGRFMKSLE